VLAIATGVAVVLLARDDDDRTDERREAVADYIVKVNTTQQTLIVELERVSLAYRELRLREKADPKQIARVTEAQQTLRRLRSRLAELPVPVEARKLRRAVLVLLDLQVELASEVAGMARYIPVQAAENRKLAAATTTLRDALGRAKTGAAQRQAFASYRATLLATVDRLEATTAPAVLEPSRTGEIKRLGRLAVLAQQLGDALEDQDAKNVDLLFPRFVQTTASTGTTPAERAAVVAFNRRIAAIADQRQAVLAERTRLDLALT
jgi:hypothetical protein